MNDLDIIVVNVENAISGPGITHENFKILHASGIDIMTPL
jgi:calcineurin-like phosphoesterase